MKKIILLSFLFVLQCTYVDAAEPLTGDEPIGRNNLNLGKIGIGVRSSINYFSKNIGPSGPKSISLGTGVGGQWKLGFGKRVNTDWFVDYIRNKLGVNGFRNDYHIGWGVQISPLRNGFNTGKFSPYFMAGQCFDLSQIGYLDNTYTSVRSPKLFSAAVQAGTGVSYFIHENFELNLQVQYMFHLGKEYEVIYSDPNLSGQSGPLVEDYETHSGVHPDGHLLGTFSITFYPFNFKKS